MRAMPASTRSPSTSSPHVADLLRLAVGLAAADRRLLGGHRHEERVLALRLAVAGPHAEPARAERRDARPCRPSVIVSRTSGSRTGSSGGGSTAAISVGVGLPDRGDRVDQISAARGLDLAVALLPACAPYRISAIDVPPFGSSRHQALIACSRSNALQVESAGYSAGSSGRRTSSTVGPMRSPIVAQRGRGRSRRTRGRVGLDHRAASSAGRTRRERGPQRLGRVRVAALGVRVVGAPHDAVDADVVASGASLGRRKLAPDPDVALEVLASASASAARRPRRRSSPRRCRRASCGDRTSRACRGRAGSSAIPCSVSATRRCGWRSSTPPKMRCHSGRCANHGELDEHDRPRRLELAEVGEAAARCGR